MSKEKPEYIRLDVTGYKQYLRQQASLATIKTGENISVTKYIQHLIDCDMESQTGKNLDGFYVKKDHDFIEFIKSEIPEIYEQLQKEYKKRGVN